MMENLCEVLEDRKAGKEGSTSLFGSGIDGFWFLSVGKSPVFPISNSLITVNHTRGLTWASFQVDRLP